MFSRLAEHAIRSTEPLLMQPVAPPDSEGAKEPPLPQPPYTPYAEKPACPRLHISRTLKSRRCTIRLTSLIKAYSWRSQIMEATGSTLHRENAKTVASE